MLAPWKKSIRNRGSILKCRDITLLTNVHIVKVMIFPVVMYRCDSGIIKKAECWRIQAFELWCWRRLKTPLDSKEIKPVNLKWNQPWILIGRTDAKAEDLILWPPDVKSWLIGKDLDAWKDWGQEEKGTTEDEMVGWHHQLDGHGFVWTLGIGDGHEGLIWTELHQKNVNWWLFVNHS